MPARLLVISERLAAKVRGDAAEDVQKRAGELKAEAGGLDRPGAPVEAQGKRKGGERHAQQ